MAFASEQDQLPGLKAWEIQRQNRRRRMAVRWSVLALVALAGAALMPARFNLLHHLGITHGSASLAPEYANQNADRARELAAILRQRIALAPHRPAPALGNDAPTPLAAAAVPPADLQCLAKAVYFEARGESMEGQIAVAQIALNRSRTTGASLCQVIYKGVERGERCQFSFACHPHRLPPSTSAQWHQAQWIAEEVAAGRAFLRELNDAEHYHAARVAPIWRLGLRVVRRIGQHIFYVHPKTQPDLSYVSTVKRNWDEPASFEWVAIDNAVANGRHQILSATQALSPQPVRAAPPRKSVQPAAASPEPFNPFSGIGAR